MILRSPRPQVADPQITPLTQNSRQSLEGGSANAYDYGLADPLNRSDIDGNYADGRSQSSWDWIYERDKTASKYLKWAVEVEFPSMTRQSFEDAVVKKVKSKQSRSFLGEMVYQIAHADLFGGSGGGTTKAELDVRGEFIKNCANDWWNGVVAAGTVHLIKGGAGAAKAAVGAEFAVESVAAACISGNLPSL